MLQNGLTVRYLSSKKFPSIHRVVHIPKRWERIVEIARSTDSSFPRIQTQCIEVVSEDGEKSRSTSIHGPMSHLIELLGYGEYIAEIPGENATGHFGLAVKDYIQFTATYHWYPDQILNNCVIIITGIALRSRLCEVLKHLFYLAYYLY